MTSESGGKRDLSQSSILRDRFTSNEIFERVIVDADEEISRSFRELFFSGLAAGFAITLTVLLYVSMTHAVDGVPLVGALLYPIGFVYIILGNYQLYTENTLPPVALVIERMASVPAMLGMWSIVLLGNVVGGALGATALAYGGVFSPGAAQTAVEIGMSGVETEWITLFFKAMFAGLIVAGIVWLDFSVTDATARFILVYMAFLAIPFGNLFHVVVASTEVVYLVLVGQIGLLYGAYNFALPVLLGNTFGGVLLVTIVNYFQTPTYIQEDPSRRLGLKQWLFTWDTGREKDELEQMLSD